MLCAPLDWQYAELPSSVSDAVLCSVLVRKMWVHLTKYKRKKKGKKRNLLKKFVHQVSASIKEIDFLNDRQSGFSKLFLMLFFNAVQKLMRKTTNFNGNSNFLAIRKVLNLSLKPEIQLQKENHTEDWALGSHPRDNGHVTH